MAEVVAMGVDLQEEQERLLSETPWIEEKFTAVYGLLLAIGSTPLWEEQQSQHNLGYIGDSEFTDWRIALKFYTDQRITTVSRTFDQYGGAKYTHNALTMGRTSEELDGVVPGGGLIWTRSDYGLVVRDVARLLASQKATLTLGLSKKYIEQL